MKYEILNNKFTYYQNLLVITLSEERLKELEKKYQIKKSIVHDRKNLGHYDVMVQVQDGELEDIEEEYISDIISEILQSSDSHYYFLGFDFDADYVDLLCETEELQDELTGEIGEIVSEVHQDACIKEYKYHIYFEEMKNTIGILG